MFTLGELWEAERKRDETYSAYVEAQRHYDLIRTTMHSEFIRNAVRNVPDETPSK